MPGCGRQAGWRYATAARSDALSQPLLRAVLGLAPEMGAPRRSGCCLRRQRSVRQRTRPDRWRGAPTASGSAPALPARARGRRSSRHERRRVARRPGTRPDWSRPACRSSPGGARLHLGRSRRCRHRGRTRSRHERTSPGAGRFPALASSPSSRRTITSVPPSSTTSAAPSGDHEGLAPAAIRRSPLPSGETIQTAPSRSNASEFPSADQAGLRPLVTTRSPPSRSRRTMTACPRCTRTTASSPPGASQRSGQDRPRRPRAGRARPCAARG